MITRRLVLCIALVLAAGCVPELEGRIRNKKKDPPPPAVTETEVTAAEVQPGVTQGTIPANQRATMRSGGSSITVEPGTFAVDVPVTMEEGDSLTGEGEGVGVPPDAVAAQGQALVVTAPEGTAPTQPFTIAMPIPGSGLHLLDDRQARLVILFKVTVPGTNQLLLGVISGDKLAIDGATVKFLAARFGSYQVLLLTRPAPPPTEVVSATPIKRKRDLPPPSPSGPAPVAVPTLTLAQDAPAKSAKGTSGEAAVTVTNGGAAVSGLLLRVFGDAWTVKEDGCGASLAAGASCKVWLYFTPGLVGKIPGRLVVFHAASGDKEIASLALDGVGLANAVLSADVTSPGSVAFGNSAKLTVTVTNGGEVASGRIFAKVGGAHFSLGGAVVADVADNLPREVCGALAPTAHCMFTIDFVSPGEGTYTAELELTAVGSGKSVVPIAVNGSVSETLAVAPAYAGASWLDYRVRDFASPTYLQGSPSACAPGSLPEGGCFHAGEILRANVSAFASCDGLRAVDALGAFQWTCHDLGATVAFFSTGLRAGKGLRDLVTTDAWRANTLTVLAAGVPVLRSPAATWFSNVVSEAPANVGAGSGVQTLAHTGRIWTIPASRLTEGYHFAAPRQALVTLGAARLSYASDNLNVTSNGTAPGSSLCAMLSASGQDHLWIEAELDAYFPGDLFNCHAGIFFYGSDSVRLHETRVMNAGQWGIRIDQAYTPRITGVRVANSGSGIALQGVSGGVLHGVNVSNSSQDGLRLWGGGDHVVTASVAGANGNAGVSLSSSGSAVQRVTLSHVTLASNANKGLSVGSGISGIETVGLLVSGNGTGISLAGTISGASTGLRFTDTFLFEHTTDVYTDYVTASFKGQFLRGGSCILGTSISLNFDESCASADPDVTPAFRTGAGTYRGPAADDAVNPTDTDGGAAYSDTSFDWLSFESQWRLWAKNDGTRGRCASGDCRIVDLRLAPGASPARNRLADFAGGHAAFVPGAACPASVAPAVHVTDAHQTASKFLKHALELLGDGLGDDDGLCETGEGCVYAPAFGAYQGSGALTAKCVEGVGGPGDVAGVKLYSFESE